MVLLDEARNNNSKPDLDMVYKPDLDIAQCDKYLLNNPLNINLNPPSYNLSRKYYGMPRTLSKYRKGSQCVGISRKKGNIPEESHLTYFHKDQYNE